MEKEKQKQEIPNSVIRDIKWHLKNYKIIDKYIKERENYIEECTNYYKYSNENHLKSISGMGSTLENTVVELTGDTVINRYEKWKYLINQYIEKIIEKENFIKYWIIEYKFINNRKNSFICEHLNIGKEEYSKIITDIYSEIYQLALKENIYRG